eukprot:SAG31_NODE_1192_length_9459_cov_15.271581_1_plen_68_part_00
MTMSMTAVITKFSTYYPPLRASERSLARRAQAARSSCSSQAGSRPMHSMSHVNVWHVMSESNSDPAG